MIEWIVVWVFVGVSTVVAVAAMFYASPFWPSPVYYKDLFDAKPDDVKYEGWG